MPPKKKQSKSKSKKKGKGKDVDPEEKLRQVMLQKALSLQGETIKERALETQFSQQSESLKGFWELEKKLREEKKRTLLEKEHRWKGVKDKHVIDLGQIKQQIKKLLFSNQDELSEKTTRHFMEYQSLSDQHRHEVGQLHNELHAISNKIQETVTSYDKFTWSMRQSCCDRAAELHDEARLGISTLAVSSEKRFKQTREEAGRRLTKESREAEDRSESTIRETTEKNAEEIQARRAKYNATVNGNLDTMAVLRKEVVLLREQDRNDRRELNELRTRNKDIVAPLEMRTRDLDRLRSDLDLVRKQKRDLNSQKQRLSQVEKQLEEIEWDHEVLFQKLQALEAERDKWKETAQRSIHSARQRSNFRNLLLERKLRRLSMAGEKDTAAIAEILQKENIDLNTLDQSQVRVTDVVSERKDRVATLQRQLQRIRDARATMLERHRSLLDAAKVQANEKTASK